VAAEIVGEFQSQPEMTRGSGGVFIVTLDGQDLGQEENGKLPRARRDH
jgi:hypothetical protein